MSGLVHVATVGLQAHFTSTPDGDDFWLPSEPVSVWHRSGQWNLAVDDIDTHIGELAGRGVTASEVQTVTKGVQLSNIVDPDGNSITLIGSFREEC